MSKQPFHIFSWREPFLPALKAFVEHETGGAPGNALIIVPNNRPWRYFVELYSRDKKPCVLPKMLPVNRLLQIWRSNTGPLASRHANPLDQVFLLHECVARLSNEDKKLAKNFSGMSMADFLPWGSRLAKIMEEMFFEGCAPQDIANLEYEVAEPASALLGSLSRIHALWRQKLNVMDWSTPGLDALIASENADSIPGGLMPGQNRQLFIAGFHSLNGTEDRLFKSLWEQGAHICLHTGIGLPNGEDIPEYGEQAFWLRRWKASVDPLPETPGKTSGPELHFFSGYDSHSQLKEMAKILSSENANSRSTAIVPASADLVMPILHHLPKKDVNISIGYPLARSPLASLFDDILNLAASRAENGSHYYKDVLRLVRQPYLRMLAGDEPEVNLREAFRLMDDLLRNGKKFVNAGGIFNSVAAEFKTDAPILNNIFKIMIERPARQESIGGMACALDDICGFLLKNGEEIWTRFPLDGEALRRMRNNVVPLLKDNLMANEILPKQTLKSIIMDRMENEHVPFEADPLTGIQLIGLLETRLLQFDRVLFIDATDDLLPGNTPQDPLLPDSLRPVLGLKDSGTREKSMAHMVRRLCACSRETNFFWQEGVSRSPLLDGKKTRSRFVEKYIWEAERAGGAILETGKGLIKSAKARVSTAIPSPRNANGTTELDAAMKRFFARDISPTNLDTYLNCPYRFALSQLAGIQPPRDVNEKDDPPKVGICIHNALYNLYKPYVNLDVTRQELTTDKINKCFNDEFNEMGLDQILPADSSLILKIAGPRQLKNFIKHQPETTHIISLERTVKGILNIDGVRIHLSARMDRLDRRDNRLHLLDYKTGRIKIPDSTLWQDDAFFEALERYCAPGARLDALSDGYMAILRERMQSIQLPAYLTMLDDLNGGEIGNAALVDLRDTGKELTLFNNPNPDFMLMALRRCRTSLTFLIKNMLESHDFSACPGDYCEYCEYSEICKM